MNGRLLFSAPAAGSILQDVLLQSADAARGKVGFCDEHGAGVYYEYSIRLRQGFGVTSRLGAGARPEIDRDAPPPCRFFTTNGMI